MMLARWTIAALALVGVATTADAAFVPRNIGTVSSGPASQFQIYSGALAYDPTDTTCVAPQTTWGKKWYFSPDPTFGHTPAYYVTTPPPAGHSPGDASYPYYEANAIFSQNGTSNYSGWTKPLAAWVPYRPTTSTIAEDFGASGNILVTVTTVGTFSFTSGQIITRNSDGMEYLVTATANMVTSGVPFDVHVVALYPGPAANDATSGDPMTVLVPGQSGGTGAKGANFTGSITSNVLTVSSVTGTIAVGQILQGAGITGSPTIVSGSGSTWNVSSTPDVASEAMQTGPGSAGPTFSAVTDGTLTGGTTFAAGDPSHLRVWPGDEVILLGDTNSNNSVYPAITFSDQIQWTPGAQLPNYSRDPTTGATTFVYVHGPSTGPVPQTGAIKISNTKGLIFSNALVKTDSTATLPTAKFTAGLQASNGSMPLNGNTLSLYDPNTATTDTWTWVTSLPASPTDPRYDLPTKEILLVPGDALTTWNNTVAGFNAATSGPTSLAVWSETSYVPNYNFGFTMKTAGLTGGLNNILKFTTTYNQTTTLPGVDLSLGNTATHSTAVSLSGTDRYMLSDVIVDHVQADGWKASPGFATIQYPSSGSLGVSMTTGLIGTTGGQWNAADWALIPPNGFSVTGVYDSTSPLRQTKNAQCVALTNDDATHVANGYMIYAANHVLASNVTVDYAGQDNFESYSSWMVTINYPTINNVLDNGLGFHPDGIQTGTEIGNVATQDEDGIIVNGAHFYPASDPNLVNASFGYTNFIGNNALLATNYSGFRQTVSLIHNYKITNNLVYTHDCAGLAVGGYNGIIAGNTVVFDGAPVQSNCYPDIAGPVNAAPGTPGANNVVMENNVAPEFFYGGLCTPTCGTCLTGFTVRNNVVTGSYVNGVVHTVASQVCDTSTGKVTNSANPASWSPNYAGGGITATVNPATVFTAVTPPATGLYTAANLNGAPIAAGPLIGTGYADTGVSWLLTDGSGASRTIPWNIGAL